MDINFDDQYVKTGYGSSATDDNEYDDIQPSCDLEEEDHQVLNLRKGPWTDEEDSILIHHIKINGEGRWNSLARHAGLKRSGKSCRLRWLNYLRPSVRRGNITLQEQLLILQLHSHWGNRWSKIAEYLPGRTDNEIKNYWRTRVQKQAKQLKCDVNSKQFQHAMRYVWIPRLIERIRASPECPSGQPTPTSYTTITNINTAAGVTTAPGTQYWVDPNFVPKITAATSSDSSELQASSFLDPTTSNPPGGTGQYCSENGSGFFKGLEQIDSNINWSSGGDLVVENLWNEENIWFLQQQLSDD